MLAALAAWVALLPAPTVGERIALEWSAPQSCPAREDVQVAVDANLARDAFGPSVDAVIVDAQIVEDPQGWRLSVAVSLPDAEVQRDVVSADCSELAAVAGLIIAVALDPLRVVERLDTRPAPPPQEDDPEEAPVAQPPDPAPTIAPEPRRRRPLDVDLRLAGVGEFGSLAVLRGGAGVGAGLVGRAFRVDLAVQYWAPRRVFAFDPEPEAGVAVQQIGGGARGCLRPRLRAVEVEVSSCVGFEVGASWARGVGLGTSRRSTVPWAAVVVGQELAWTSRRKVGVWLGVDGMLHVVRPRFTIADLGIAAQTRWVGLRITAGPSVRL